MKLFLASQDFGNHVDRLRELVGENRKVLFINNAKDYYDAKTRAEKSAEKKKMFGEAGFEAEELDLRGYFGEIEKLDKFVRGFRPGLVFCLGGNTFILRKALSYSGMDVIISRDVRAGKYVYGGGSAGSIVAGPSLAYFEAGDDPQEDPYGYRRELIWEGMGLTDVRVVPHGDTDWFGEVAKSREVVFKNLDLAYVALNDADVYVVDGEKSEILR